MIFRGLLVWLTLVPFCAWAQGVQVRSGEHGTFTRLVFDIPAGTVWNIDTEQAGNQVRLTLSKEKITYQIRQVFDRIDQSRIAALDPLEGTSSIDILMACNCEANAFQLGSTMVVIDFRDNDEDGSSLPIVEAREADTPTGLAENLDQLRLSGLPGIGPDASENPLLPNVFRQNLPVFEDGLSSEFSEIGNELARDVAAAASRGLLALEPGTQIGLDAEADFATEVQNAIPINSQQEVLTTQFEAINRALEDGGEIRVGGAGCVPTSDLRIWEWKNTGESANNTSQNTAELFGEFDRINPNAITEYAKNLLYFGFGAEARSVLSLNSKKSNPLINALSYVVDGEIDPTGFFETQVSCDTSAAMWSIMSSEDTIGSGKTNVNAVMQAFELLPKHLRNHLGPILASRLMRSGNERAAGQVLERLQRAAGGETTPIKLGKARLDVLNGAVDDAERVLTDLAVTNVPEAKEAIVSAIQLAEITGRPIPERIVKLSEAFSTEFRNSDEGTVLWVTHVKALLTNGDLASAISLIENARGVPENVLDELRLDVVNAVTLVGDEVLFLKHILNESIVTWSAGELQPSLLAAERLSSAGLFEESIMYLEALSSPTTSRRARLLRAEALLGLSRPEQAEISLIGLRDEQAIRLRAEARKRMGDYEYAQVVYEQLGDGVSASNAAWLSGDLDTLADQNDSTLGQIASRLNLGEEIVFGSANLSQAEALSDRSVEVRTAVRDMLNATKIEE